MCRISCIIIEHCEFIVLRRQGEHYAGLHVGRSHGQQQTDLAHKFLRDRESFENCRASDRDLPVAGRDQEIKPHRKCRQFPLASSRHTEPAA